MAKAKMGQTKSVNKSVWQDFVVLQTKDGWTITYSEKSKRGSLRYKGEFRMSDISLTSLKRIAELWYAIDQKEWTKINES